MNEMENRYQRNIPTISESEQESLKEKKVAIIGCGGLGGYLCELTARLGIGHIIVCDGDIFEESNLNRQILSSEGNLGTLKAEAAKAYIECTNPACEVTMICQPFSRENTDFLDGCDLVLDALDSAKARLDLAEVLAEKKIPLVHGAVSGFGGQVAVVMPGNDLIQKLYENHTTEESFNPRRKSVLPFTVSACASMEMAEAIKLLSGRPSELINRLLVFDLSSFDFDILVLS